jgi:putative transposase
VFTSFPRPDQQGFRGARIHPPPSPRTLAEVAEAGRAEAGRAEALRRWNVLRPHLQDGTPLSAAAAFGSVPMRTAQAWLARLRAEGLSGLARSPRADRGARRLPQELQLL